MASGRILHGDVRITGSLNVLGTITALHGATGPPGPAGSAGTSIVDASGNAFINGALGVGTSPDAAHIGSLRTTGDITATGIQNIQAGGQITTAFGNLIVSQAGNGLKIKEGSDAKQGTAVLNGTTAVVVTNASVTANSRIFLTINTPGGTPGSPYVSARSAGVSFSIKSTGASDSSTVAYFITEPS